MQQRSWCVSLTAFGFLFFPIGPEGHLLKMGLTCCDGVLLSPSGGSVTRVPSNGHRGDVDLPKWTGSVSVSVKPFFAPYFCFYFALAHFGWWGVSGGVGGGSQPVTLGRSTPPQWPSADTSDKDGSTPSEQACFRQNTYVSDIKEKAAVFVLHPRFHTSLWDLQIFVCGHPSVLFLSSTHCDLPWLVWPWQMDPELHSIKQWTGAWF